MIQKFRWRFIYISIASLFIVLAIAFGGMLAFNYNRDYQQLNRVMDTLVQNDGTLTPRNSKAVFGNQSDVFNRAFVGGTYNPEAVGQYRFFTVVKDDDTGQVRVNKNNVYDLDTNFAQKFSTRVWNRNIEEGRLRIGRNIYYYRQGTTKKGEQIIIFLNETLIFSNFFNLVKVSLLLGILSLIVFATVLILISKRAIKPISETYDKQREFITNAGHELKTPLAIISANVEMEEMLGNNSEWNESTKEQAQRLTKLIDNLIAMAKTGETGEITLSRVNFSDIVKESSDSFKSLMQKNELDYQINIAPNLNVLAEKQSLTEVVNILLDNAAKYCDPNGKVVVNLYKSRLGTQAVLRVSNTYKNGKNEDYRHFFDRFYRSDESHNSKKSGYGIGLSMAQDLVHVFRGKMGVSYKDNMITFSVNLKLNKEK